MVRKFLSLFIGITILTITIDQFSKYFINLIRPEWDVGFLSIHYSTNSGAAFSILQNQSFILGLVSLLVAGGIIFYYPKIPKEKIVQVLFSLFLGGVLGNMLDRLLRGYVIDFIDFKYWPSFNFADMAITISTIGLIIYYWKE